MEASRTLSLDLPDEDVLQAGAHRAKSVRVHGFEDDSHKVIRVTDTVKISSPDAAELFGVYRRVVIRGDEIVHGVLRPELHPDSPRVQDLLTAWGGMHYSHQGPHGVTLTLMRPIEQRRRERWWLHLLLGLATLLATTMSGAYFLGRSPASWFWASLGPIGLPIPVRLFPTELLPGLAFSVPLMVILFGHEMGHYVVARRRGIDASPPYFIPSPPWLNVIGTFGAFIRLRSVMLNRAVLLDIGAWGPLMSFVLSLPALWLGLLWSDALIAPPGGAPAPYAVAFEGRSIWLGGSILVDLAAHSVGAGADVLLLHPLAFAGWLGLFVTALNMFPLSQLDGGHILYALIGGRQRYFGWAFLALLVVLGNPWWGGWWGWWLWAALILLLGRGAIAHPPVFDPTYPIGSGRRWLGWICVLIFVLTFVPSPIRV